MRVSWVKAAPKEISSWGGAFVLILGALAVAVTHIPVDSLQFKLIIGAISISIVVLVLAVSYRVRRFNEVSGRINGIAEVINAAEKSAQGHKTLEDWKNHAETICRDVRKSVKATKAVHYGKDPNEE